MTDLTPFGSTFSYGAPFNTNMPVFILGFQDGTGYHFASSSNPFPVAVMSGGGGGGGGSSGPVTMTAGAVVSGAYLSGALADGAVVTIGTEADAAWTTGSGTVVSILKGIYTRLGSVPVTGTFWQATQPVSGTVAISGTTTVSGTVAISGTVPVSGTVADSNSRAFFGEVAMTVGTTYTAGRSLKANCTVAGNVSVTYSDALTGSWAVSVGIQVLPIEITAVNSSGTTATATYSNMK